MQLFLRRLDRFIEHTIDWDLIAPSGKPMAPMKPKVIFDNLRYYPLLGLLAVVTRALVSDGACASQQAGSERLIRDDREEPLGLIEPAGVGRHEVHVPCVAEQR
jgi:hypothetical protein